MKKKKVIILQHGGGELANQLWNFASIYAYCLEKDFDCQNYSFFEYGQYFNIPLDNRLINLLFFKQFQNHHHRRNHFKNKFWRLIYKIYTKLFIFLLKKRVVSSVNTNNQKIYLPPTQRNTIPEKIEVDQKPIYFTGWLFRNPDGLKKYHTEIVNYFIPKIEYTQPAEEKVATLKKQYKNVVGVHIRQGDYKEFKGGQYFISQTRVREILNEYLNATNKNSQETFFILTSDGPIEKDKFSGLNFSINKGTAIDDLYTLSLCDVVIGSNSSFGNFACYYGNKPHIIFKKEKIDWEYYKNRNEYFENKYCTVN